jgi:hypothetical protein
MRPPKLERHIAGSGAQSHAVGRSSNRRDIERIATTCPLAIAARTVHNAADLSE